MIYSYNGWLAIDKPLGVSSSDVVIQVRKLLKMKKVGHSGTLDPLATGVLLIAVGEATKLVTFAMANKKRYSFTLSFGHETNTDDREGEETYHTDFIPSRNDIEDVIPVFLGEINQVPPVYSAIKKGGKKLCDLARKGEEIPEIDPRKITIYSLELEAYKNQEASFNVDCSKGTYIRSLGRDIARKIGSRGHISSLVRTSVGNIDKKMIISLDKLKIMVHNASAIDAFLPVESVLDDIPVVDTLQDSDIKKLRCGVSLDVSNLGLLESKRVQVIDNKLKLVAIGSIENGLLKPVRVFNL